MGIPLIKKKTLLPYLLFASLFLVACTDDKSAPSSVVPARTVSITIAPETITLSPGGEQTFAASVSGSTNTAVSWSILEGASGGSISSTNGGTYTAPLTPGTYHFVATSQADASKAASAIITVSTSLNASFGTNGTISTAIGGIDTINAMKIQSDGKILVAGASIDGLKSNFALARYESNGTLDTTFGVNGVVSTSFGSGLAVVNALAIQTDGKIVAGGNTHEFENGKFALARYLPNGTLDPTFGPSLTGTITALPSTDDNRLNALILQGDKILVGGASYEPNTLAQTTPPEFFLGRSTFTLMRFNANGTTDTTFGSNSNGIVKTLIQTGSSEIFALDTQLTGEIVAGGQFSLAGNHFALARYDSDGNLDTSFSTDGIVTTTVGGTDRVNALDMQTTGEIVAGGFSANSFALVRYTASGLEDTNFSGDGMVTTSIGSGGSAQIHGLFFSNNRIIVGGLSFNGTNNSVFTLARYDLAGALDTTFGSGGITTTAISTGFDGVHALTLASNKIFAAGFAADGHRIDFALARYNTADGSLDTAFNTDGFTTTALGGGSDEINALEIQTDGKMLAAGFSFGTDNIKNKNFALTRYEADGTLDANFGSAGHVTTSLSGNLGTAHDIIKALVIQNNGSIVVGGLTRGNVGGTGESNDFALARYLSNGNPDPSFGSGANGIEIRTNAGADEVINALSLLSGGEILVGGTAFTGSNNNFILGRYTASGILDTTFNTDGIVTTQIGTGSSVSEAMSVQNDGKVLLAGSAEIVVIGNTENTTSFDFALARYLSDGTLDPSFDGDGIVTTAIGTGHDFISAIKIQSDGKILVAGTTFSDTAPAQFALARYNTDGSLDLGFGNNGIVITPIGSTGNLKPAQAFSLEIQDSDGKIIVGGFSAGTVTLGDFSLVRYLSDGTLDTSFGVGGIEISPFSAGMDEIHALRILSNGTILAGGMRAQNNSENTDFHLAGYTP